MTSLSNLKEISLENLAAEELLLVSSLSVVEPTWRQLIELGFIDHPDGAYQAGQLLSINFPEFQNSDQFNRQGF